MIVAGFFVACGNWFVERLRYPYSGHGSTRFVRAAFRQVATKQFREANEGEAYSMALNSVCVFCGSTFGARDAFKEAARQIGRLLAQRAMTLVYGGGDVGLMGVVADAAMEHGGIVIGVIPKSLVDKELAHHGITKLYVVDSMHERKAKMAELSDAFIALPGGFGTFEEFCEIVTWSQLGFHQKPCGILNVKGYFEPLLSLFDRGVTEQFIRPEHREIVISAESPDELLEQLTRYSPAKSIEKLDRQ